MNPLVHFRWYRRWRGGVWGHHSALLHPWKTWTRFDYRPDDFSERLGDEDWRALPTPNFCEACAMDLATCDCAPRPAVVVVRVPPNPCYTAPPQHHTMTTDEALLTADGHGGDTTQALAVLAAEVRRNAATVALMREALAALDWCLEDTDELIAIRAAEWGSYRADRQAVTAAKAAEHRAIAERLRAALTDGRNEITGRKFRA